MSATIDQVVCALGAFDASAQKSDTVDLVPAARALYVGGAGDLKVTLLDGSVAVFSGFAGGFFPVSVKRLWSNGTNATLVLGLV